MLTLGNIYFLDYTLALWKIDSNGILSQPGGVKSGCSAFLHQCLTVDSGNNVYTPGGTGVLKITTSGSVSQIPVTGLSATSGIAVDSAGNIYLSDVGAHDQVLEVMPGGATVRFAGNNLYGYGGDGGPASQATLFGPVGLALDSSNNLLIADNVNGRIRKVFAQSSSVSYTVAPADQFPRQCPAEFRFRKAEFDAERSGNLVFHIGQRAVAERQPGQRRDAGLSSGNCRSHQPDARYIPGHSHHHRAQREPIQSDCDG